MSDIELVIKIPENRYKLLLRQASAEIGKEKLCEFEEYVLNGIPLPKGHGRLIDTNILKSQLGDAVGFGILERCIDEIEPIIEADKE